MPDVFCPCGALREQFTENLLKKLDDLFPGDEPLGFDAASMAEWERKAVAGGAGLVYELDDVAEEDRCEVIDFRGRQMATRRH